MELKVTSDYGIFQVLPGNRVIDRTHVELLKRAMVEYPEMVDSQPLLVNKAMQVVDGSHRLAALKELHLPVTYIVAPNLTLEHTQIMNLARLSWKPDDFAKSYAGAGNLNYQSYIKVREKYGLNHWLLKRILMYPGTCSISDFRAGKMVVTNLKKAEYFLDQLTLFKPYYSRWAHHSFAIALWRAHTETTFDLDVFFGLVKEDPFRLKAWPTVDEALRGIQSTYNANVSIKNRIDIV